MNKKSHIFKSKTIEFNTLSSYFSGRFYVVNNPTDPVLIRHHLPQFLPFQKWLPLLIQVDVESALQLEILFDSFWKKTTFVSERWEMIRVDSFHAVFEFSRAFFFSKQNQNK